MIEAEVVVSLCPLMCRFGSGIIYVSGYIDRATVVAVVVVCMYRLCVLAFSQCRRFPRWLGCLFALGHADTVLPAWSGFVVRTWLDGAVCLFGAEIHE